MPAVKLASSASSVPLGISVTFTATLTARGTGAVPSGTVTFLDGASQLGTAAVNGSGTASYSTAALAAGSHLIVASYGGNGDYTAAVSAGVPVFVGQSTATALAISSAGNPVASVAWGRAVALTASVALGGAPATAGTVNFCDATAAYCTDIHRLGTAQLTGAGTAVLRLVPGIGSHSYKAAFAGTATVAGSTSAIAALAVTGTNPSATAIAQGGGLGDYSLTATVAGAGSAAPTGTVSYLDTTSGSAVLGTASLGGGPAAFGLLNVSNPAVSQSMDAVAVGDFNGDGNPDLAVANFSSNTIAILLGNGKGGFTPAPAVLPTGNNPIAIAVGDFNGDGNLDLAVANYGDGTVTVLLGNGDGTFTPTATSPNAGTTPNSIAVGDFNRDGNLDLAVANFGGNAVTILLGDGKGGFTATSNGPATGNGPVSIAAGDFNGDGATDLAVANYNDSTVTILLGDGKGNFTAAAASPTTGSQPNSIVAADFNGDGKADLATANFIDDTATVLLGKGDGSFAPTSSLATGSGPYSIAVGDFNGDGIPDLATANYGNNTVTVLQGDGAGNFTSAANSPAGQYPISVAVGDFNGDGRPDLAVANYYDSSVTVFQSVNVRTAAVNHIVPAGGGTHQVEASYAGDVNYRSSVSATVGLTGQMLPPKMTLTSSATTASSVTPVILTVKISGSPLSQANAGGATIQSAAVPSPTGTVVFLSGSSVLGTGSLNGSGEASIAADLPAGQDSITAEYRGDTNYAPSTSSALVVSVAAVSPAVAVIPSSPNASAAQPLPVTVVVSGGSGAPAPTGVVTLTSGIYNSAPSALAGGSAIISVPAGSLSLGANTLTVVFTPDPAGAATYNNASSSATVTVNPGFALAGTSVSVAPGATSGNVSTITVTPSGGFTGSVTLTAALTASPAGAQNPPTLSFGTTSPVVITGTSPGTALLTVTTTAPSSGALGYPKSRRGRWQNVAGAALACVLIFCIPARRRRGQSMLGMLLLLFALSAGFLGCGGSGQMAGASGGGGNGGGGSGGNSGSGGGASGQGTTAGTYTVTVTGTSGTIVATGTVTLIVQ